MNLEHLLVDRQSIIKKIKQVLREVTLIIKDLSVLTLLTMVSLDFSMLT